MLTEDDLLAALKSTSNGKSPGSDGIQLNFTSSSGMTSNNYS